MMKISKKILIGFTIALSCYLGALVPTVLAATSTSLVSDATIVTGGNLGNAAQIRSTGPVGAFGGVSVVLDAPIPWASLATLSSDFNVTDDSCGGGSPRAQIRVDTDGDGISNGSVRVSFGPSPSFTGCSTGWQSTGNLIGNADGGRYDYSVFGGSPFTTYSNAPAIVTSGQVVGVFIVVDGSWNAAATGGDSEQTTLIDNIVINSNVEDFDISPVTIISPLHNAMVTTSALDKVDWTDATDGNPLYEYQYEAFGDLGYLSLIYSSGWLPNSEIATPGTPPGDYYLRVRARDILGSISDWSNGSSNVHKITVVADPTPTPTPINPFPVPAQCNQNIAYNLIEGTDGSNNINGTNGSDLILAKGGSDKVDGKGGADCIVGGGGSDKLIGGTGNDVILGGDGSDSLQGNDGADKLYGGNGSDSLKGGNQNDMLWGGNDSDSLHGDSGNDTLDGESGIDSAKGGTGTDTCTAESVRQCEI